MLRVLFLAPYPRHIASTRFRATQFFPFLEEHGVSCELAPQLSTSDLRMFYGRGTLAAKAVRVFASGLRQAIRVVSSRRFDAVVVQRGALLFGPPLIEGWVARVKRIPLVYDFDDAIWLNPASSFGWLARMARSPWKVGQIARMARHVIVCNQYTRDHALRFAAPDSVTVIPTVVDADVFHPTQRASVPLTIGWIGTHSTAQYLTDIVGPLSETAGRFPFRLKIVGSGRDWRIPGVDVVAKQWSLAEEVADYQSIDIGLYPVADDEWGRGKTGFKPVVYMSSGAACIASPVGGVTEFLRHGVNGLLASSPSEWRDALTALLSDEALRRRLAEAGRRTVQEKYCLRVQAPRLLDVLERAAARSPGGSD